MSLFCIISALGVLCYVFLDFVDFLLKIKPLRCPIFLHFYFRPVRFSECVKGDVIICFPAIVSWISLFSSPFGSLYQKLVRGLLENRASTYNFATLQKSTFTYNSLQFSATMNTSGSKTPITIIRFHTN